MVPIIGLCQSKLQLCTLPTPSAIRTHAHEDGHSQCSLFSVLFAGLCPFREGSVPGLLWDPLLRVALLDVDAVPLQEAICCRSSVETVTMHSSEGSEAAAAHELFRRGPTLCRDFMAGVWAVKWRVDKIIWQMIEAVCCVWVGCSYWSIVHGWKNTYRLRRCLVVSAESRPCLSVAWSRTMAPPYGQGSACSVHHILMWQSRLSDTDVSYYLRTSSTERDYSMNAIFAGS